MRRRENQGLLISHQFITIFFKNKSLTGGTASSSQTFLFRIRSLRRSKRFQLNRIDSNWNQRKLGIFERESHQRRPRMNEVRSSLEFLPCPDNLSHTSHGTRNAWERVNCCSLFASSAWVVEVVRWIARLPQDWEVLGLSPASSISYSRFNQSLVLGVIALR